jgi:hypothetical protein
MEEPLHLTLRQLHAQCLATPRGCLAERAKALRSGVLEELCLLVGGQQGAHGDSVAPARATGEFVQSPCAIPSEPFLDGANRHADDFGSFFEGSAASEQGEGLEASGDLGVGCVVVVCVDFFGSVFPVHCEFSSTHWCSSYVRSRV